ncbi:acyltransferase family protein [Xenorhabdus littoralis]|uniref:acyltransferase family protein n=1 Tax=Xenorhabdus littoralis TaxID=2582835 RepID=UPI0029E7EB4E|nr:acyltransferase [Xenorhabdus sp. psl]MDX7992655.1 acyltransferase [Xenorhabdus sp. psl]
MNNNNKSNQFPYEKRQELPSLTGIRFLVALLVFLFHASLGYIFNPFENKEINVLFSFLFSVAGWIGVSFFFILSGFVMVWSARATDTPFLFWGRRAFKIYPVHIITWSMALAIGLANFNSVDIWITNFFLVHSWFSSMEFFVSVNPPSWSLCSEVFFYALFPFILKPVLNIKPKYLLVVLSTIFIGLISYQIVVDYFVPSTPTLPLWPLSESQWWLSYNYPLGRLFEFIIGMILARITIENLWRNSSGMTAIIAAIVGYVIALYTPFQYSLNVITIIPISVIVLVIASMDLINKNNFLKSRLMILLGEISFAFYMSHYLVLVIVKKYFINSGLSAIHSIMLISITLLISLFLAYFIYIFIERPIMNLARRYFIKKVI